VRSRLSRHEDGLFRATLGAVLALWAWMLWPNADHGASFRGSQRPVTSATTSLGSVAAVPASIALSAKSHLNGAAAAAHGRIDGRLPQVALAMPEIGVPEPSAIDGAASTETPPAAGAAAEPAMSAGAGTGASATRATSLTAGALDLAPEAALVGRAEAAIEPAAPPATGPRSAGGESSTVVALLQAPATAPPPRSADQRTPTWLRNAVASTFDDRPALALVIDDLGFNRRAAAALNRLPGPLTLAFLPYATKLDEQARAARAAGHELLVHVPMEPRGQESPGPNALTSQLEPAELVSRLRTQLRSFRGFVGINNHMGSLLTADAERMAIVMAELRRLGLLFLDSRTTPQSVAAREAERIGVPHTHRDVFIDHDLDRASVLRALERATQIARHHGHAVAIGHPHDVTIQALEAWLPTLERLEVALVPISAIAARRSCASGVLLVADACARYAVAATAAE
jgi:polysaccharide deacetylase 2 family uncharacterized protein YibQ